MTLAPRNAPPGFDWVARLADWNLTDNRLTAEVVTAAGKQARFTAEAVSPPLWHIGFIPPGCSPQHPSPMIVAQQGPRVPLSVQEDDRGLTVTGPQLMLRIDRDPWRIAFKDEKGRDICRENPGDVDGLGRAFALPLGYVAGEKTRVYASFHLRQDEHLFGLGEKFTRLEKTGQRIVGWNEDALGSTSERSHKNVPFLWSTRGYGMLLDCTARILWDLGTTSCQTYTITAEAPTFDAYLLYGPAPDQILLHFADLTGHAPVPPRWTFGLWVSSGGTYRDRTAVERLVEGLDIPADVVHIDPWWMRWRHYCDFTWDESAFPHPKEFIERLHALRLKLCLWEHPYISTESELFAFGKKNNYFVLRPDGEVYVIDYGLSLAPLPDGVARTATPENSWNARVAIVDLTNPQARTWFKDLHRAPLRMGVDLFKTDFGEDIPEDAVFSNGQTGASMHNLYPLLYNEAVFEVTREEKGAGIVWSRSGTAGNQRYPVCWSGDPASDFDSLACTIRGGLSAGLSGIPFWSNDIGGYRGVPDEDLYIRWAQFGLLCSHSRMHGDSPREPRRFGPRALEIVRKYIELRYRLFPYIYSTAHEASRTGIPVLRPLVLAFPDDPNSCAHDLEFLLGPWLLLAPVCNREGERDVYFPPGVWIDYWDGKRIIGPSGLRVSVPIERLPLYVRAGAILPMMEPVSRIPTGPLEGLILDVYPYGESTYHLHEDEGTTEIRCLDSEEETSLEWSGNRAMRFTARFNGITASEVLFDGSTLRGWAGDVSRQEKIVSLSLPRSPRGTVRLRH